MRARTRCQCVRDAFASLKAFSSEIATISDGRDVVFLLESVLRCAEQIEAALCLLYPDGTSDQRVIGTS